MSPSDNVILRNQGILTCREGNTWSKTEFLFMRSEMWPSKNYGGKLSMKDAWLLLTPLPICDDRG